ncbi:hypothetical protein ACHAXS_010256 [Conticribra weissflogii]
MKSPFPTLVYVTILLSSSAMSSSFSSSTPLAFTRYQRMADPSSVDPPTAPSTHRLTILLRGGDASENSIEPSAEIDASPSPADPETHPASPPPPPSSNTMATRLGPNAPPPGLLRRTFPSFPWHSLPNYLTYARCLSIPLFLLLSYLPPSFPNRAPVLGAIFALASITDWFDGFLARRWDIASPFGAFLDPVADKLMVSTALIVLSGRYGGAVAIPSAIILAREVGVSALREWMAQRGKRDSVKVGMQGKVKAALTMISISLMLLVPEGVGLESLTWSKYLGVLGVGGDKGGVEEGTLAGCPGLLGPSLIMLFGSAVVTVTSGSVYFKAAAPVLLGKE